VKELVEEEKAKEKDVTLGLQSDIEAQVLEGLEEGEEVILNPRANIKDGTPVRTGGDKE